MIKFKLLQANLNASQWSLRVKQSPSWLFLCLFSWFPLLQWLRLLAEMRSGTSALAWTTWGAAVGCHRRPAVLEPKLLLLLAPPLLTGRLLVAVSRLHPRAWMWILRSQRHFQGTVKSTWVSLSAPTSIALRMYFNLLFHSNCSLPAHMSMRMYRYACVERCLVLYWTLSYCVGIATKSKCRVQAFFSLNGDVL